MYICKGYKNTFAEPFQRVSHAYQIRLCIRNKILRNKILSKLIKNLNKINLNKARNFVQSTTRTRGTKSFD